MFHIQVILIADELKQLRIRQQMHFFGDCCIAPTSLVRMYTPAAGSKNGNKILPVSRVSHLEIL